MIELSQLAKRGLCDQQLLKERFGSGQRLRGQTYAQTDSVREFRVWPLRDPILPRSFGTVSAVKLDPVNGHGCLRRELGLPCGKLSANRSARIHIVDEEQIDALLSEFHPWAFQQ